MFSGKNVQVRNIYDRLIELLLDPTEDTRKFHKILACIMLICTFFGIWSWYPGTISDDAMAQYLQAIGNEPVTDWHPPLMVRLWQLEIMLFGTANLLNATFIVILSLGLFLFLRLRPCLMSLLLYPILFFSPIFFGVMGYVYKDILLSNIVFLSMAIYVSYIIKGNFPFPARILLCTILIIFAFLRFNAAFLVAPLIMMIMVGWRFSLMRLLGCSVVMLVLLSITGPVNHILLRAGYDHPERSLEVFDLGGIAHYSLPDDERKIAFQQWDVATEPQKLSACYLPGQWDEYGMWVPVGEEKLHIAWDMWGGGGVYSTRTHNNQPRDIRINRCFYLGDKLRSDDFINKLWISSIKEHPIPYLHHRYKHFIHIMFKVLGSNASSKDPGYYSLDLVEISSLHPHWITHKYTKLIDNSKYLPTNYGVFCLVAMILIFFKSISCDTSNKKLLNALSFSAIIYLLGYFFVGVGSQFRYILPSLYLLIAALLGEYALNGRRKIESVKNC